MSIGQIGTPQRPIDTARRDVAPGRALVPVAACQDDDPPAYTRPTASHRAAFIAHLLATRDAAPQTRERRRAEPAEAAVTYKTAYSTLSRTVSAVPSHMTVA